MNTTVMSYLFSFLNILASIYVIYSSQQFFLTKNKIFFISGSLVAASLIYITYKMFTYKLSLFTITLVNKVIPTIFLSLLSFYVFKSETPSVYNVSGLILITIGLCLTAIK